jgi:tRNA A37 threonylcarbamoyladenosine biosynthesis protein TsaE
MNLRMAEMIIYEENAKQEDLELKLKEYKSIKQYAGILHDKDDVKNHYHIMLKFSSPFETNNLITMFKDFNLSLYNISKIKGKYADAIKYLLHQNATDKYQYQKEQVFSNFDIQEDLDKNDNVNEVILQYSNLEISYNKLWKLLTPQQRMTYKKQIDRATEVRNTNIKLEGKREMKVLYIYGATGLGKTTMAKWLCDKILEIDYYISSSSNDILQDYLGQEAIILDEFRPSDLSFSDMLKLLDNHTNSTVKSRYYNKAIDCKYLIITTTQSISDIYKEETLKDRLQLYRRISEIYYVTDNSITAHEIDIDMSMKSNTVAITKGKTLPITPKEMIEFYRIVEKAMPKVSSIINSKLTK